MSSAMNSRQRFVVDGLKYRLRQAGTFTPDVVKTRGQGEGSVTLVIDNMQTGGESACWRKNSA